MNWELDVNDFNDPDKREAADTLQRKRTGGNQQVTVKHIHQQVNVTQGGQAVVAGDKVTSRTRGSGSAERRREGGQK